MRLQFTILRLALGAFVMATFILCTAGAATQTNARGSYQDLLALFAEWRAFERPPLRDGAPDYTAKRSRAGTGS